MTRDVQDLVVLVLHFEGNYQNRIGGTVWPFMEVFEVSLFSVLADEGVRIHVMTTGGKDYFCVQVQNEGVRIDGVKVRGNDILMV